MSGFIHLADLYIILLTMSNYLVHTIVSIQKCTALKILDLFITEHCFHFLSLHVHIIRGALWHVKTEAGHVTLVLAPETRDTSRRRDMTLHVTHAWPHGHPVAAGLRGRPGVEAVLVRSQVKLTGLPRSVTRAPWPRRPVWRAWPRSLGRVDSRGGPGASGQAIVDRTTIVSNTIGHTVHAAIVLPISGSWVNKSPIRIDDTIVLFLFEHCKTSLLAQNSRPAGCLPGLEFEYVDLVWRLV